MKRVPLQPCSSSGEGRGSGGLSSARGGGGEKEEEQKEFGGQHRNRKTIRGMEIMSSLEVKRDALSKSWPKFQFVLILHGPARAEGRGVQLAPFSQGRLRSRRHRERMKCARNGFLPLPPFVSLSRRELEAMHTATEAHNATHATRGKELLTMDSGKELPQKGKSAESIDGLL